MQWVGVRSTQSTARAPSRVVVSTPALQAECPGLGLGANAITEYRVAG